MKLSLREKSAYALVAFLESVQARPREECHHEVREYLHSQASLAKYDDQSVGIRACSLNTLKKSCSVIPGGFMALDAARRRALAALEEHEEEICDVGASKRALQNRVKKLRQLLQASTEDLLLLTRLLERALRNGRQYAVDSRSASLIERCAREQAEVRDMLSLRQVAESHLHVLGESE